MSTATLPQQSMFTMVTELGERLLREPTNAAAISAAYTAMYTYRNAYEYDEICRALLPLRHALLFERGTVKPLRTMLAAPQRLNRHISPGRMLDNRPLYVDCMRALRSRAAMLECRVRGAFAALPPEVLADIVLHSCFDTVNMRAQSTSYPFHTNKWRLPSDRHNERLWHKARRDLVRRSRARRERAAVQKKTNNSL
jgi:hypothetical protein